MSKINDLIRQLSPSGVPFRAMWELTIWDKRFNAVARAKQPKTRKYTYLLASELRQLATERGGTVKLLGTGGENFGWTTPEIAGERMATGEIIAIPGGGNPSVQYFDGNFVTSDNRIAIAADPAELSMRFLYYVMQARLKEIKSYYRGAGIQHPSMAKVLDMRIPVPPLEVQQEIVRILDSFSELEARRRQYEHYKSSVFDLNQDAPTTHLGAIVDLLHGFAFKSPHYVESGIRIVRISDVQKGVMSDKDLKFYPDSEGERIRHYMLASGDLVMSLSGSVGRVAMLSDSDLPAALNQRVACIRPKVSEIRTRYLFHYLNTDRFEQEAINATSGGTVKNLSSRWLKDVSLPLPSLEIQDRIVEILDKFDALVNDLSAGLPAELVARRQQYEYYRDRLLTFKEAA